MVDGEIPLVMNINKVWKCMYGAKCFVSSLLFFGVSVQSSAFEGIPENSNSL